MKALAAAVLLSLFILGLPLPAFAQSVQQVKIATKIEVYAEPAFKSKVLERLSPRTVISMSTNKIIGKGGLGVFFKIKTPTGKIGYIADSDLVALPMDEPQAPVASAPPAAKTPAPDEEEEIKPAAQPSPPPAVAATIAWGASAAMLDYTEELNGQSWKQSQVFFGLRRTSSSRSAFRLGHDLHFMISPWAPKFLADAGAYGSTSGYVLAAEWLLYVPLLSSAFAPFFEVGPSAIYSSYQTQLAGAAYSNSKTSFAGVVAFGFGYEFSKFSVRLDVNYHLGAASYLGERFSLQAHF